jgi:N-acetylmuramoyl-L-alanine amidase-like protein
MRRLSLLLALALVPGALASPAAAPQPRTAWKPIPYPAKRKAEMAAYARRHYGPQYATWRLVRSRVIVEHYTGSSSFSSAYNTFAADVPDGELHELPGVCAHYVIDTDGTIYQLVSTTVMCRHTVGLNYTAIGIEHVGRSDADILGNPRQLSASFALTLWLMETHGIALGNVIGHNESLTSRYHRELYPSWRCQTHGDWVKADMDVYRAKLGALARRYAVPLGPTIRPVRSRC